MDYPLFYMILKIVYYLNIYIPTQTRKIKSINIHIFLFQIFPKNCYVFFSNVIFVLYYFLSVCCVSIYKVYSLSISLFHFLFCLFHFSVFYLVCILVWLEHFCYMFLLKRWNIKQSKCLFFLLLFINRVNIYKLKYKHIHIHVILY